MLDAGNQHWSDGVDKDGGRAGNTAGRLTLWGEGGRAVNQDTNLRTGSRNRKRKRCEVQAGLMSV